MNELKLYSTKIANNALPINTEDILMVYHKYKEIYPGISDLGIFFQYLRNYVGSFLMHIDMDVTEHLGWLELVDEERTYFYFPDEEDYLTWLGVRIAMYSKLNKDKARILNYLELSVLNFVTDRTTKCKYKTIKDGVQDYHIKDNVKFGTTDLAKLFQDGHIFIPVK
jgi:hypothetical protein